MITINRIQDYYMHVQASAERLFFIFLTEKNWERARYYNDIIYQQHFNRYNSIDISKEKSMKVKLAEELDAIASRGLELVNSQLNQAEETA